MGPDPGAKSVATVRGPPLTWPGSPSPSAGLPASWPGSWRQPRWPSSGPAAPCGLAPGSRGWQAGLVAGRQPPQPQPPEQPTPGPGSHEAGTTQPGTGTTVQERACSACFPLATRCDGICVSLKNVKMHVLAHLPTGLGLLFAGAVCRLRKRIVHPPAVWGSACSRTWRAPAALRRQGPSAHPSADVWTPLSCLPGVWAQGSCSLS